MAISLKWDQHFHFHYSGKRQILDYKLQIKEALDWKFGVFALERSISHMEQPQGSRRHFIQDPQMWALLTISGRLI